MAVIKVFSVYDSCAEAFTRPVFVPNRALCIRSLEELFRGLHPQGNQEFVEHAEDYTLFELGSFDEENGLLDPLPSPVRVIGLWEVKAKVEKDNG